ncbi:MAG: ABC transporter substrate-binding protein [Rhodospirillaceae bacterium TMED8]|nr:ABC transporter substrate-binding protein [Magnetovibrio sp.]OUT51633.1 MAG: ABC transporter substrate-binding protein [Rhodospirillaceae bacterium TMED8]|tara:strand:- start:3523 stop:4701 length:1179 start_codon:yes stop_codon:yes gene_type:complete
MKKKDIKIREEDVSRRNFLVKGAITAGVVGASAVALTACDEKQETKKDEQLATPAIAKNIKKMVVVSTWPRDFPGLGTGAQRCAQRIADMSDGQIQVEYFAAKERVGAFDSFDEVSSGNAQAYHAADYYWKGKHLGWGYFTSVPFGLTYTEMNAWIRFGGGQELWDELAAEFGLKCVMAGNTGCQMGGWFNKEINSADDLKGLKMRIPGLGGDVMAKLGASPVSLPGGQIYENLVSGAIDATEWVGPWNDSFMKFYEAAKYYYYPGMHEPGSMLALGVNKKFWDSLSKSEKAIVEGAASMENDMMMAEYNMNSGSALTKLVTEQGVKLRKFSDDVYDSFAEAAEEVFAGVREHSALAKKIDASFVAARKDLGGWSKISDQAFLSQRNRALGL